MRGNKVCKEVRLFFSRFNQLYYAFSKSREIKSIRERLDEIAKDYRDFGSMQGPLVSWEMGNSSRETHSFVCEEDVIIGRDEDKRMVIDMLCDATVLKEVVSVVSIVGIGGLGKTTLAQLVYNDDMVQREFQLKMWVCVSDDFNVQTLVCKILAAAINQPIQSGLSLDQLQRKLRQELEGKKYLLVLDDIWDEDPNKWHEVRKILSQGGRGSRIIVTTRSMKVASVVGSHANVDKTHELKGLSDQDSWNLFEKMALEPGQHQHLMEPQLVEIGKDFVRKCVNVPLALKVIGSLLKGQSEATWRNLVNTDLANIDQVEKGGIIPVLKISYNYLPFHLKCCFSYCAIFPKDHLIMKEELICLWMAQGFIVPLGRKSIEDVGEEYFMNLLQRCFFQDVIRDELNGNIFSCKMHDLVHDLAQGVAGTEIIKSSNKDICSLDDKTYHIYIDIDNTIVEIHDVECCFKKMKNLRTWYGPRAQFICFEGWFLQMRYLRVLDLSKHYAVDKILEKLPDMISQLVHLRYLDLSNNDELVEIPNSIAQLINLQTLKLSRCRKLKELPRELSKLVNLRHLDISGCSMLKYMPSGMNRMSCLHKLTHFIVGGGSSHASCLGPLGGVGKLGDLKYLNNLRDKLEIEMKEGWAYNNEIEMKGEKYLMNKPLLNDIEITWNSDLPGDIAEALLQGLQPHPNIKRFALSNYSGGKFLSWGNKDDSLKDLNNPLPNLVEISLGGCTRLKHVPLLSQLCHLKSLFLYSLDELEYVEDGFPTGGSLDSRPAIFFPALVKLNLKSLPKLKGWRRASSLSDSESVESDIQILTRFPCLSHLVILDCPNYLTNFPSLPKVESLKVGNCSKAFGYFHSLPTESFQNLTELAILFDSEIVSLATLPYRSGRMSSCHSSIRSLKIEYCYKLKSISGKEVWEHFTALEQLTLNNLPELEMEDNNEMPWRCLAPSLRSLYLGVLPNMKRLPMGMQHLTSLRVLQILLCFELEEIPGWISCLTSLQHLKISNCPRVKSLPEEMQHLTCLDELILVGCSPELEERCQEPTGADWHKIKHIRSPPFLNIGITLKR